MSAHSAEEIIIVVAVQTLDRALAEAIALAVVSGTLKRPRYAIQSLNGMRGCGVDTAAIPLV